MTYSETELQSLPKFQKEWVVGSGVSLGLTRLNCRKLTNESLIANVLGWKGYHGGPGWVSFGMDLETGEMSRYGQFKPDIPLPKKGEKPMKYVSFGLENLISPLFLQIDILTWEGVSQRYGVPIQEEDIKEGRRDKGFWLWVLKHPQIPLVITEGVKKTCCLLTYGFVPLCLLGVQLYREKGTKTLAPEILSFKGDGRKMFLAYDADISEKKEVFGALRTLGAKLEKEGIETPVVSWDKELGKGVDDLIVDHGIEKFEEVLKMASNHKDFVASLEKQFKNRKKGDDEDESNSKFLQVLDCIQEEYQGKVRLSIYGNLVYQYGVLLENSAAFFNNTYKLCCEKLGFDPVDKHVERSLDILFEDSKFNPVVEYLETVKGRAVVGAIERLAIEGMGCDNPFQRLLFRKQLIANVARAYQPGCQVDSVCVLYGKQGYRKTSLLSELGGEWYRFLDGATTDKDTRMIASKLERVLSYHP